MATWGRTYQSRYTKRPKESPAVVSPPPPLGDLIQTLTTVDLEDGAKKFNGSATIDNARTVTSYNWVDKPRSGPTILVPGKPPLWTPEAYSSKLREDSGSYFRDKNAARYPKHPMEPAVAASLASDPAIPSEVDLFACGNTIGNLLRFVRGQDKTFRMLAYKIHRTVFLVRRENSPTELIPDVRGYGHTFPEANTTWEADVKGSASHQRLIRYTFGGLDMVVRFEADGYIKLPGNPNHVKPPPTPGPSSLDALAASLSTTAVTSPLPSPPTITNSNATLTITPAGTFTPHSDIFELKTRSIYTRFKKNHLAEELPRLWVSRIPTFILAFHTQGLFKKEDTEIKDVRDDVRRWEKEHAGELARLAALLHWVRDAVGEEPDGRVEVCYGGSGSGEGKLEVRRILGDVGEVLSDEVMGAWEGASVVVSQGVEEKGEGDAKSDDSDGGKNLEWHDGDGNDDFTACRDACGYCGRCTY